MPCREFLIKTGSGSRRAFEVDDVGWLWMASANRDHVPDVSYPFEGEARYAIPPQGLNNLGNPIYSWTGAVKVMDAATGRSALSRPLPKTSNGRWRVDRTTRMVYALAWSNRAGLSQDGGAWMGGNVLFGFRHSDGQTPSSLGLPKWCVALPKQSVGMVPIWAVPVAGSSGLIQAAERWAIIQRMVC